MKNNEINVCVSQTHTEGILEMENLDKWMVTTEESITNRIEEMEEVILAIYGQWN